ncbi:Serine/threonine-protein kinase 25 [Rhizophlyctis rosea]|nr:Serine/threonine-protein kinase 25 [Rhizophlyctis rosea]
MTSAKTRAVFAKYDTDQDGFWTEQNFGDFLSDLGKGNIGQDRIRASFQYLDTSKSGKIDAAMFERGINLLYEYDFDFGKAYAADDLSSSRATIRLGKHRVVVKPEASDPMELWTLIEKVGEGSYGEIYKAISKTSPQIVALKIIDLERTTDDLEDLLAEVDFQAKCYSPHLARYFGSWMWDSKLTIAMEFLGGGTAEDLLKHTRLNEEQCAYILRECAKGLEYMHGEGKIHRDIKAANILFDNSGAVKLADFGVAAQLTARQLQRTTFVGTPLYMAPEIILNQPYGPKVDVWSLGVMAIELATRKAPRCDMHPMDVLYAIPTTPSPQLDASFSPEFRDWVNRCLQKSPETRPMAKDLLQHPFTSIERDKSLVKGIIENIRLKKNDTTEAVDRKATGDDWWVQYNKQQEARKVAQSPVPTGPVASAEARATIRPDMAQLDTKQTYGRRQAREAAHQRGAAMGPVMRRVGVPDGARGRGGFAAQAGGQAQPQPEGVPHPERMGRAPERIPAPSERAPERRPSSDLSVGGQPTPFRPASPGPTDQRPPGTRPPARAPSPGSAIYAPGPPPPYSAVAPHPIPAPQMPAPIRTSTAGMPVPSVGGGRPSSAQSRTPAANLPPPSVPVFVPSAGPAPDTGKPRPSGTYAQNPSRVETPGLRPSPIYRQESGDNLDRNKRLSVQAPPRPPSAEGSRGRPVSVDFKAISRANSGELLKNPLPSPNIPSIPSEDVLSPSPVDVSKLASAIGRQAQQIRATSPGDPRFKIPGRSRSASESLPPDHGLSETIIKLLPPELFSPSSRTMRVLRVIDELHSSELRYMETLQSVMEVYVRPLITAASGRSAILKEDQIKTIFVNFSALHPFSVEFQQMVRETIMDSNDAMLDVKIMKALEDKMPMVEQLFSAYASHLTSTLWEVHKALRDSSKFRDFAVHARLDRQCGDRSLFELLTVPVGRIAQYAILFEELAKATKNPSFAPIVTEMRKLSFEMAGAVDNCAQLILMLVHIADIPHPMILKNKQQLLIAETVEKVDLGSGGSIKKRRPTRLYLLKDAIVIVKMLKEQCEPFDWLSLFEPKPIKLPKPALQYKEMLIREFVEAEVVESKEGEGKLFSLTVNVKKGKTHCFSAPNQASRDRWIGMTRMERDSTTE